MVTLSLAAVLMLADPAAATTPAQPTATANAPVVKKASKDAKICRQIIPTGSIMPVKRCYTPREMDVRTDKDQDGLRTLRERAQSGSAQPD